MHINRYDKIALLIWFQ